MGKVLLKLHGIPQRYHSRKEESINAENLICIIFLKISIATPVFSTHHTDQSGLPLIAQSVKNLSAMQETWVQSLGKEGDWVQSKGWEDPLEKGMATHSSILP